MAFSESGAHCSSILSRTSTPIVEPGLSDLSPIPQIPPQASGQKQSGSTPEGFREYTWEDIGFSIDKHAETWARVIDWSDILVLTSFKDKKSKLFEFGAIVSRPGQRRIEFVKSSLRAIFPPFYFVNRNASGRVPNNSFAPKGCIDPAIFKCICDMAQYFCTGNDNDNDTAPEIIRKVNRWLSGPAIKPKLEVMREANGLISK